MNSVKTASLLLLAIIAIGAAGCSKKYLEDKTISKLLIPTTLEDVQSLLDNTLVINDAVPVSDISADNFYISYATWQGLHDIDQNTYIWARDIYNGQGNIKEWDLPYQQALYANVSLDALNNIDAGGNPYQWNVLKGSALFIRAFAFFNVAQLFAVPFDDRTADTDLGIPLRLSANINETSRRSSVRATYKQITDDLATAVKCLPASVDALHPNRPSKPAACALLSRVYLSMRDYTQADAWADSCLQLYNKLLDYNTLNTASPFPFKVANPEILYTAKVSTSNLLMSLIAATTIIDSTLYQSYAPGDLRFSLFYTTNSHSQPIIKAHYSSDVFSFMGIAIDEVYLTRAECCARNNNTTAALNNLNTLLKNRYKKTDFSAAKAATSAEALQLILQERRKELPFRGLRWMDIRRLNKEGANITLKRRMNDTTYALPPLSPRFVLPIPPDVIALTGMPQNQR